MTNDIDCGVDPGTGMAGALLSEIAHHLVQLAETGEPHAIDLKSLPMTPADRAGLERLLGQGEVAVKLNAGGVSDIRETAFSGVWWVRHCGADGRVVAETIEVTPVPGIVVAHAADIRAAATRLANLSKA